MDTNLKLAMILNGVRKIRSCSFINFYCHCVPECEDFITGVLIFLSRIHELESSKTHSVILTLFFLNPIRCFFFIIIHLIEHDLLAFNSGERALHLDGTLRALGDVNVKEMDSDVMFPGWRNTTNRRYKGVFCRNY